MRFAIGESVVAALLPSFEVVADGGGVASEALCDAGCAPVLCGGSDGEGGVVVGGVVGSLSICWRCAFSIGVS